MFHVVLVRSGPDWDPSRRLEEQSDWLAHASFMDGLVAQGFIVLGGPLADEHRVVHVVESDSEETVRDDARARSLERNASTRRLDRPVDDSARRAARLARRGGQGVYCWSRASARSPATRIQKPFSGAKSGRFLGFLPLTICASSATAIRVARRPLLMTVTWAEAGTRYVSRRRLSFRMCAAAAARPRIENLTSPQP